MKDANTYIETLEAENEVLRINLKNEIEKNEIKANTIKRLRENCDNEIENRLEDMPFYKEYKKTKKNMEDYHILFILLFTAIGLCFIRIVDLSTR